MTRQPSFLRIAASAGAVLVALATCYVLGYALVRDSPFAWFLTTALPILTLAVAVPAWRGAALVSFVVRLVARRGKDVAGAGERAGSSTAILLVLVPPPAAALVGLGCAALSASLDGVTALVAYAGAGLACGVLFAVLARAGTVDPDEP